MSRANANSEGLCVDAREVDELGGSKKVTELELYNIGIRKLLRKRGAIAGIRTWAIIVIFRKHHTRSLR